jgi:hypothetical protein
VQSPSLVLSIVAIATLRVSGFSWPSSDACSCLLGLSDILFKSVIQFSDKVDISCQLSRLLRQLFRYHQFLPYWLIPLSYCVMSDRLYKMLYRMCCITERYRVVDQLSRVSYSIYHIIYTCYFSIFFSSWSRFEIPIFRSEFVIVYAHNSNVSLALELPQFFDFVF